MVMFCGRTARFVLGQGRKSWRQVLSRLGSLISHFFHFIAWQIGMIARSEARQRGMQATKSLTPPPLADIILSLRFGHKMIYMDILPLPRIHEEQLSAAGERQESAQGIGTLSHWGLPTNSENSWTCLIWPKIWRRVIKPKNNII